MMGPQTLAERLDIELEEARNAIDRLQERNSILESRLIDLLADLQRIAAMVEDQMNEIDQYLKRNK